MRLLWALGTARFHLVDVAQSPNRAMCGLFDKFEPAWPTAPDPDKCKRCAKWWFETKATNPEFAKFVDPEKVVD